MLKTFSYFHHWFAANNIDKPVTVVLRTDAKTADQIGWILRDEFNKTTTRLPMPELVKEGQIYGITFKIEVA